MCLRIWGWLVRSRNWSKRGLRCKSIASSKESGLTQVEMAKILGVRQPQVSLLMRNRAGNFSVGRLMEFLISTRWPGVMPLKSMMR
jgi:hypothetical protein